MTHGTKHIVGFSGGIDSQACARWVLNRYHTATSGKDEVVLINSDAGGNEDGMTTEFVEWYSGNIYPVIRVHAIVSDLWAHDGLRVHVSESVATEKGYAPSDRLTFDTLALLKGRFPSSQASFCTDILKIRPTLRWIKENAGDCDYVMHTGKRRDESKRRAITPASEWDLTYDCQLKHDIFDWTKEMCFEYVQAHGERYNSLYELGFSRVGCAPCHQSNKEDILNWTIRKPENIDKIDKWEQRVGRTFFPPMVPGMAINFIQDVVEWAKTSRGGRQQPFPIFHEREACESKYGLCE